jgi:hypothetical protein
LKTFAFTIVAALLLTACDKGYRVRFANYYIERMDSVIISGQLQFSMIERQQVTDYKEIKKGKHDVRCVAKDGRNFSTSLQIPSSGGGDRTIQIDAVSQVSVLEN